MTYVERTAPLSPVCPIVSPAGEGAAPGHSVRGEHHVRPRHQVSGAPLLWRSHFNLHLRPGYPDGLLVDAGPMAKEAGYRWPVALTAAVWPDCVPWIYADSEDRVHQDPSGRLWDVLFTGAYAIRTHGGGGDRLHFSLDRVPRDGCSTEPQRVTLKLNVGPGDGGEPVIAITAAPGGLKHVRKDWHLPLATWVKVALQFLTILLIQA
jgi:hypothetical protein